MLSYLQVELVSLHRGICFLSTQITRHILDYSSQNLALVKENIDATKSPGDIQLSTISTLVHLSMLVS